MLDPRSLQRMMKKMGMQQEELAASEVVIKTSTGTIRIKNPTVLKISMRNVVFYQIQGEEERIPFTEEDIKLVMEKTGASEEKVKEALKKVNGDIAEAIMLLLGE